MKEKKTLFLLDAMALIYRSYFAFSKNPRINSKGLNTSAVLGFANTLLDVLKNQKPTVFWMTGLSGSGKSTIANAVEKKLAHISLHTFLLDGDNVRHRLNKDLGFTDADRIENIRRVGEVTKLMTDAGLIVITAFISPFRSEREMVRDMIVPGEFVEVFIDTPLSVAEERDVKGLYAKARSGQLKNFTGIDSPYEAPEKPEIRIDTTKMDIDEAAEQIVKYLLSK